MVLPDSLPLVPAPVSALPGEGLLPLASDVAVTGDPAAAALLIDLVAARTGIRLPASGDEHGGVVLGIDPRTGPAEGYRLAVADAIEVVGSDAAGLAHGIRTLLQLLTTDDAGRWAWRRATVADAPRFAYRGVMLDVARRFFPVDEVKLVIDRAAALKFNHLHLHLSDDQGWRIHIDAWPLLSQRASTASAMSPARSGSTQGGCYSKDDYREIVAHAASRHVTIVPEIDMPGHTHAIGVAYPELVEAPVMNDALLADAERLGQALPRAGEPYTGWGVGHSSLRIHQTRTYEFVRDVLTELAELTPGPYLHIGGDESLGTSAEDFSTFIQRATAIVTDLGKTPIAWHEAGAAEVAPGTVGQYWGALEPTVTHAAHAAQFVRRGGSLILSPSDAAYLDMKYDSGFPLGLDWAGTVGLRRAYEWEPAELLEVAPDAIAGVEAALWTESVGSLADAEQLMYPRIAAAAEIAWSTRDTRSWDGFRERLGALAPAWRADGIRFHPVAEIDWTDR
ncbi:family 20 glycosylhydrolase [Microbacterium sp. ARD32]|uniref:family 20 glycosylhydrolase n=1 Tax=Microbacterium sp. ARD32 TaxID=2962577 RepID=UPI0028814736|nr:family 20 glycosylhydrolase [Microbacterium sp. ARD32]MDT0156503.1 family 20 glycosylhydrolase [Microbacterium sp. ARD32]